MDACRHGALSAAIHEATILFFWIASLRSQ
jgi:hypothetical protein